MRILTSASINQRHTFDLQDNSNNIDYTSYEWARRTNIVHRAIISLEFRFIL